MFILSITGVTVYRSDGGAVSNPPAAHSGGIAVTTTPSSAASSQQPPAAHIGGPSGMNQPPTNLKAEQISKFIVSTTDGATVAVVSILDKEH